VSLLVTGGFDNNMMYWDVRQQQPVFTMHCPGKVQYVASKGPTMVMTCLNCVAGDVTCRSAVYAYDKSSPSNNIRRVVPDSQRAHLTKDQGHLAVTSSSPECMSYQIRSIGMMRGGAGWALGGSEGRCVLEHRHDFPVPPEFPKIEVLFKDAVPKRTGAVQNPMSNNFHFKCHRDEEKKGGITNVSAFPVNGVAFNGRFNTMATCGSNGTYAFWDKDNRQKLKEYPAVGNSIIDIDFSPDSNFIAFAVAYDWAKGLDGKSDANEGLYVRRVPEADIAPKKKS
jgi:mRNA export factor